jgi:streptogramin lyase
VATLGTLYLALPASNTAHAFATVESVQMGIVALLAIGAAAPAAKSVCRRSFAGTLAGVSFVGRPGPGPAGRSPLGRSR